MQLTFNEPSLVCAYGPSGWGKTTDCLYSFPDALFIAAPGALKPWHWVGLPYEPACAKGCSDIFKATELIRKEAKSGRWTAVVCDDWSLLSDVTFSIIEKDFPKGGHPMWGAVRDCILAFRTAARDAGLHIILNAHERGPHMHEKKGFIKGGPMLPGTMPEDFPKSCDMVLRVKKWEGFPVWPMLYSGNEPDETYVEKDRHGFVPPISKVAPMNLGELMRQGFGSAGGKWSIRRPRGLEWMEDVVEKVAATLLKNAAAEPGSAEQKAFLAAFEPKIREKHTQDTRLVNWIFRDAIARALLRREHTNGVSSYTR